MSNMHLVTGFAGREHVTAADHGSLYAALFGSGTYVLDKGKKFELTKISDNLIRVLDGDLLMQGRHCRIEDDAYVELTVENGTQGYLRRDLVVCRYTKDADSGVEGCELVVLRGDPVGAEPADPAYITGDIIKDGALQNDVPLYRLNLNGLKIASVDSLLPATIPVLSEKLNEHSEGIAALQAALAGATGAKMQTGQYAGTGTSGTASPLSLTFEFVPKLVFIFSNDYDTKNNSKENAYAIFNCMGLRSEFKAYGYHIMNINNKWFKETLCAKLDGTTLTWYTTLGLSSGGVVEALNSDDVGGYSYIAFG